MSSPDLSTIRWGALLGRMLGFWLTAVFMLFFWVQAEAPAGEIRSGVLEVPIMDGTNGECPASSLHSHSLGGDAYSEDEFEEACDDVSS